MTGQEINDLEAAVYTLIVVLMWVLLRQENVMDIHKEVKKIDKRINKIAKNNPITHENAIEWLALTRTVQIRLEIFKAKALGILREG